MEASIAQLELGLEDGRVSPDIVGGHVLRVVKESQEEEQPAPTSDGAVKPGPHAQPGWYEPTPIPLFLEQRPDGVRAFRYTEALAPRARKKYKPLTEK